MLVNAVVYRFPPEKADEAEAILKELAPPSRAEPGCVTYEVARANDDPSTFMLYEVWRDQAALEAHYEMPHFKELGMGRLRPLAVSRQAVQGRPVI